MGRPIYGYMRAYEATPESETMKDELRLFRWAQNEGYELAVIYQEVEEGSTAVLTELLTELRLVGDTAVLVPSTEHFGTGRVLREHLTAYQVHCADIQLSEVDVR
ncbi:hypothetical protein [Streptomyces sp. CA-111067]|uniref:hypothetical protein n=1 Tax=Streptomyces sp. CA-111067 TaxID=3240046 RepID=UPI003D9825DD